MQSSPFWLGAAPLLLASGSETRRKLLEQAGIPVDVQPAVIDERAIEQPLVDAGAPAHDIASHLARSKALAASALAPGRLVLGADQTLSLGPTLFHKPTSREVARAQLEALAGKSHRLASAFCLALDGEAVYDGMVESHMTMRVLSPRFVDTYLTAEGDAVFGSVGGYRFESLGAHLFDRITGPSTAILGLPMPTVLSALRQLGYCLA